MAARSEEVGRTPFARRLLDEPVMLYRRADGAPVALEDRCCHRNLPLSQGRIEGDDVRCGYHGLRFDATGRCVEVPGQSAIPPDAQRADLSPGRALGLGVDMDGRSRPRR